MMCKPAGLPVDVSELQCSLSPLVLKHASFTTSLHICDGPLAAICGFHLFFLCALFPFSYIYPTYTQVYWNENVSNECLVKEFEKTV